MKNDFANQQSRLSGGSDVIRTDDTPGMNRML